MLGEATLVDGSVEDQAVYKYKIPSKAVMETTTDPGGWMVIPHVAERAGADGVLIRQTGPMVELLRHAWLSRSCTLVHDDFLRLGLVGDPIFEAAFAELDPMDQRD